MWTGIDFLLQLQNIRLNAPGMVNGFFEFISTPLVYVVPILIVALVYLWFIDKRFGRLVLLTLLSTTCITNIVKCAVKEPRPWIIDDSIHPSEAAMGDAKGYSFPSGHSSSTVSGYGQISFRVGNILRIALIVLISLIVFSRLYLGVHTPLDVIAGITIGIVMIFLNQYLSRLSDRDDRTFYIVCAGYVMFAVVTGVCIASFDVITTKYAAEIGALAGASLGIAIEHRFVGYVPSGFTTRKVCACIICLIPTLTILAIGYYIGMVVAMFSVLLATFMVTAFIPYVLKRCSDDDE